MSSRLGLGRCRVVWTRADVELSEPRPIESSGLGPMSSRPNPADVKPS